MGQRPVTTTKTRRNLERFDIVLTVLLAGWVPSILMLLVSYTTLKKTLESKILRDRQTFVQLIGHLVDDDLASTASIVSYYQTLPDMERLFTAPNPQDAAQQWIAAKFFSYPRIREKLRCDPLLGRVLRIRSEEHTSDLQSRFDLVCRLLLEKKKKKQTNKLQ